MFFPFCHLIVLIWLSVPVQVIDLKDSAPKCSYVSNACEHKLLVVPLNLTQSVS